MNTFYSEQVTLPPSWAHRLIDGKLLHMQSFRVSICQGKRNKTDL